MNNEQIWQGTMLEALWHTQHSELRAVLQHGNPDSAFHRNFLRKREGHFYRCDDCGSADSTFTVSFALLATNLYRQSPGYELREMTLLAAMAYAQEKGLEWLEDVSGLMFRQKPKSWTIQTRREHDWEDKHYIPINILNWRIPTDSQWTALTVAEVEALGVQDA